MAPKTAPKSKPRPSSSRRSNRIVGLQSKVRGIPEFFDLSNLSDSIEGTETSSDFSQLRSMIGTLKALGDSKDVISRLLAKHGFDSKEALELMFINSIISKPPTSVDDSSVASSRKGNEKVSETFVSKKITKDGGRKGDNDEKLYASFRRKIITYVTDANCADKLIKSEEYQQHFKSLMNRGVIK
ncbi:hypothetical protein ACJRO7_005333 [Eucalyptus globulus]|uniref:Uncharacterized protein n=1 Tax=Eucalyptus globulus TaxID=34317 RepID=A0ABD3J5H2_EUCGL